MRAAASRAESCRRSLMPLPPKPSPPISAMMAPGVDPRRCRGRVAQGEAMTERQIEGYHAHVYYDAETRPLAERLRHQIGERFAVRLGRWHDAPVGPHPRSMYQVAFEVPEFPRLVP